MWVSLTAEYVVFTDWPPGPDEQYKSMREELKSPTNFDTHYVDTYWQKRNDKDSAIVTYVEDYNFEAYEMAVARLEQEVSDPDLIMNDEMNNGVFSIYDEAKKDYITHGVKGEKIALMSDALYSYYLENA